MTPHAARVVTEPLGGSPLSLALQSGGLPPSIATAWPIDRDGWATHAHAARAKNDTWLDAIRDALSARGAADARLRRVASNNGIVVTTGQQAGLFAGPLYTLTKALSALELADELEEQLGVPTAAVFWAATDDADYREASRTWVADADGLVELALESQPAAGTPMSVAPLGSTESLLAALRKASGSAAHGAYLDAARSAYMVERTIGDAYVHLLREILQPLGIAVLDSSHPACLKAERPVLLEAARRAPEIAAAVTDRSTAIRALGFEPQVQDERGLSLVYATEQGIKRRLPIKEAPAASDRGAAVLTPNVLLRPVVERALLPTVAYVAGPGELAYYPQSAVVADTLGLLRPMAVPRWSCTVVESFVARALDRLGVAYEESRDLRSLEKARARDALPREVMEAWQNFQSAIDRSIATLGNAVRTSGLLPPEVIEGLRRSLAHRLSRTERRLLAAAKRRDAQAQRDLAVIGAALHPLGKRQERVLNFIPILTRGGEELVEQMRRAARAHARQLISGAAFGGAVRPAVTAR